MGHLIEAGELIGAINLSSNGPIAVEIDLGSPRHKDCTNFGICRINYYGSNTFNLMPSCCPNRAYGYIRKLGKSGVEIILNSDKMAPATIEKHLASGWFTIIDEYQLPSDIAQIMRIDDFRFKPGIYRIKKANGVYHIAFINE